jgi:hypothetical protein
MLRFPGKTLFACLGLLLATIAIYWAGLTGPFLFDDYPNIVSNPLIQIEQLDWPSLKRAAGGYVPGELGRPLATIGFAIDFLFWGKNPWGYKLHSVIVHAVNTVLVFGLVRRLLGLPAAGWTGSNQTLAACVIAMVWAAHPLQVSTVLYVVQRMEMLALTFVLSALLVYLHGRLRQQAGSVGWPWLLASAALAGLGLLSKENAALFPVYTLALELTVLKFAGRDDGFERRLAWAYGLATAAAAVVFFLVVLPPQLSPEAYAYRDFSLAERLLTQLRVLPLYLGQIILPMPGSMVFYYDQLEPSRGLLNPVTTLLGALLIGSLLAIAVRYRHRRPLLALGIGWFFGAHLITSNVLALELVFEHRNYFAILGIILAVADLVQRVPVKDTETGKSIIVGLLVAFVLFLGVIRSATWGSELHLLTDFVSKNPDSPRASNDLATFYVGMSDGNPASPFYAWGMKEFERGSHLPKSSPLPEQGLILAAASVGEPVNPEWWDRIIVKLETNPIGVQERLAVMGLVTQRMAGIELDDRRLADTYTTMLRRSPQPAAVYAALGDHAANRLLDDELAMSLFLRAIDSSRNDPAYVRQIIGALVQEGHFDIAQAGLVRAQALGIDMPAEEAVSP